ncbi:MULTISPECIES: hypothetical protein [Pontibacillus]|uniref:Uncharacterized protein n=1 Tax=Pontibacillus chungwhensis TaxID=265426 RepID=A0ABY8V2A5_9BACI|nr:MULTISPECIES: hypothetical protein [Pontibacillus]MCD5324568.1 hypothetical protein [Pontibacillus sp. HN14]WIF99136.1 hypothetical protein QNI29_05630 [Pontibacillus chungwhensis]
MGKRHAFLSQSFIGLMLCVVWFFLSAFSEGFHRFVLHEIGWHPLLVTIIVPLFVFVWGIVELVKVNQPITSLVNLGVMIGSLLLSAVSLFTLFMGLLYLD